MKASIRVGADLRFNGIAIRNESGTPEAFAKAVAAVEETGTHLPEVLMAEDPVVQEAGLALCGNFRPLMHAATEKTADRCAGSQKSIDCPLAISAPDLPSLGALSKRCQDSGVKRLVLDLVRHRLPITLQPPR